MKLDPFAVFAFVVSIALAVALVATIRAQDARWAEHDRIEREGVTRARYAEGLQWSRDAARYPPR